MTEKGFKYAELPGGKLLKFPESATDKEIQRAVRRELGLGNEDFLTAFEGFSLKVGDLIDARIDDRSHHRELIDELADNMQANVNRLSGEITDAVKTMEKTVRELNTALSKTMSSQANLIIRLDVAVQALNKTLDAAMGESLAAMDSGRSHAVDTAVNFERSMNTLAALVDRLNRAIEEAAAGRRVKRRAVRERDGSWTMESL